MILGLALILVFVWITMLIGLVLVFASLPFLISTLSAYIGGILESIMMAGIALIMVLTWLTIWKRLAFGYFTRSLSRKTRTS